MNEAQWDWTNFGLYIQDQHGWPFMLDVDPDVMSPTLVEGGGCHMGSFDEELWVTKRTIESINYYFQTTGIDDLEDVWNDKGNDARIYACNSKGIVEVDQDLLNQSNGQGLIRVFSTSGEQVKETSLLDLRTELELPGYTGFFIIILQVNDQIFSGKVIKTE